MNTIEAQQIIGINIQKEIKGCKSFEAAQAKVPEIRQKIKRLYREKSKQLHPDLGGTDVQFRQLKAAYDLLKNFRIERPQPVPTIETWIVKQPFHGGGYTSWTSSDFSITGMGGWWSPMNMRGES